jgi:two-component system phosphate regulon sensor histidine kinase PhoR
MKWALVAVGVAAVTHFCGIAWAGRAVARMMGDGDWNARFEVQAAVGLVLTLTALSSVLTSCLVLYLAGRRPAAFAREVRATADRMAAGDLGARSQLHGTDDLAAAARALDHLAVNLEMTLADLHRERAVQGQILEEMQEGVLVLDRDGRIVMMNPAFRAMLLLGTEAKGKPLVEVVRHDELYEIVNRARTEHTTGLGEIDLPGIKPRRLLTHATAFAGETGGLLAVFVDVTDLRRLESLRRDFVANVSHELRTPVTAMRSAAETLRVSALYDTDIAVAARFVSMIERNGERLQSLIEDLLELSRLESKEFRLKWEEVDLAGAAATVVGLFRERAEKKGVRLSVSIGEGATSLVTDQRALEQVVANLVDNAVKYCGSGATVTIATQKAAAGVCVLVRDTGPGIHPKHLPRLFERFYRVDAGRSRDVGGTGLGLSIVKHLTEAMGGQVTVETELGKGSSFALNLPGRVVPGQPEPSRPADVEHA